METTAIYYEERLFAMIHPYRFMMALHSRIKARLNQRQNLQKNKSGTETAPMRQPREEHDLYPRLILSAIYRHHIDTRCIDLSIDGRTVILKGMAESGTEKNCIEQIVAAFPGVKKVTNFLQII